MFVLLWKEKKSSGFSRVKKTVVGKEDGEMEGWRAEVAAAAAKEHFVQSNGSVRGREAR